MKRVIKIFVADILFVCGVKLTIASAKMSGFDDMAKSLHKNLNHPFSKWGKPNAK
jgi:hypothetical protein